jgi:5'-nucleotidase
MELKRNKKTWWAGFLAGLALLAFLGLPAACQDTGPPDQVPVQILAINDFHGHISPDQQVNGRPVGGAPVLAAYLKKAQQDFAGPSFIASAGDLIGASPPDSALLQDEPAVMFMNLLGNDKCSGKDRANPSCNLVATVGNHEFDEGMGELRRLLDGGNSPQGPFLENPWQGARFPSVVANVVRADTHKPLFPPYVIKKVDGLPIAFIGAVLKGTRDMVIPSHVAGLRFLDEAKAINSYIPELKKQGVRTIIVLLHQGGKQRAYEGPTRPGDNVSGAVKRILWNLDDEVDVVISGHTHAFTNALIRNSHGKEMLVTQAWAYGRAFADIKLAISRASKDVVSKSATIVTAWADTGAGLTPDPAVAEMVRAAEAKVAPLTQRQIATTAGDITRSQDAAGESALGNLIADAQRKAMGTDFAFMNMGGIRGGLAAGKVTWGELYTIQPFNNCLVRMELTGQQIYDLLNQQFPAGPARSRMLQVSGLTYTWDNKVPPPGRIVEVRQDGKPIDKAATYTVTANSFLAEGGDKFSVFKLGANKVAGPTDLKALVDYLQSLPQPVNAKIDGRIERLN